MDLSDTRIGSPERCDRILLILLVGAVAAALPTLLGAAGEAVGLDRPHEGAHLEGAHAFLAQPVFYFDWLLTIRDEWGRSLMQAFGRTAPESGHRPWNDAPGPAKLEGAR